MTATRMITGERVAGVADSTLRLPNRSVPAADRRLKATVVRHLWKADAKPERSAVYGADSEKRRTGPKEQRERTTGKNNTKNSNRTTQNNTKV